MRTEFAAAHAMAAVLLFVGTPALRAVSAPALGAETDRAVLPFVTDDTLAVARVDAASLDFAAVEAWLLKALRDEGLTAQQAEATLKAARLDLGQGRQWMAEFRKAGGRRIYAVVDFAEEAAANIPLSFTLVVPLVGDGEAAAAPDAKAIVALLEAGGENSPQAPPGDREVAERVGDAVVWTTVRRLAQLRAAKPAPRPDLLQALAEAGGAPLAVAIAPGPAARKVLADGPAGFAALGEGALPTLARDMAWTSVAVRVPPRPQLAVVLRGKSPDGAKALAGVVNHWLDYVRDNPVARERVPDLDLILAALRPVVKDERVTVALDAGFIDRTLAPSYARQLIRAAKDAGRREAR